MPSRKVSVVRRRKVASHRKPKRRSVVRRSRSVLDLPRPVHVLSMVADMAQDSGKTGVLMINEQRYYALIDDPRQVAALLFDQDGVMGVSSQADVNVELTSDFIRAYLTIDTVTEKPSPEIFATITVSTTDRRGRVHSQTAEYFTTSIRDLQAVALDLNNYRAKCNSLTTTDREGILNL